MIKLKAKYEANKNAKVGDSCICPSCNTSFIKQSYQQAFCKTKAKSICKDKYWNTITPNKRNNTTRISPANAAYRNSEAFNIKTFGMVSPNVIGGSGRITGMTSEGYRIMDGVAYDEFDDPVYTVDEYNNSHPMDLDN